MRPRSLAAKNLDLIVANDVGPGSDVFGSDTNRVTLISRNGEKIALPKMPKREVAKAILDYLLIAGTVPGNQTKSKGTLSGKGKRQKTRKAL